MGVRSLLFTLFLLATAILPALGQPPVRGDIAKQRQASRKWELVGKLYSPDDDSTAALFDLEQIYRAKIAAFGLGTDPQAAQRAERYVLDELSTIRYLSTANIPAAMRPEMWELVSFGINSLSRTTDLIRPATGGENGILIRIDLRDYDIRASDYDNFAVQEPYHNQDLTVVDPANQVPGAKTAPAHLIIHTVKDANISVDGVFIGKGPELKRTTQSLEVASQYGYAVEASWSDNGKQTKSSGKAVMRAGATTTVDLRRPGDLGNFSPAVGKTIRAMAAWINPKVNSRLAYLISSPAPVIRADWFLSNALLAPAYYDLLRIKTIDDFRELTAFDQRAEDQKEVRATVVRSGSDGLCTPVARNNRIIARIPSFQGSTWATLDFLTSVKAQNVINNFLNIKTGASGAFEVGNLSGLKDAKEWLKQARKNLTGFKDASELIGNLPNGLQVYLLTDGQDKVINEADIRIAYDLGTPDLRVRSARSCITCHSSGHQKFVSHFQLQVSPKTAIDLGVFLNDQHKTRALVDFIRSTFGTPDFAAYVDNDQNLYRKAIKAVNGSDAPTNASAFNYHYVSYAETDLDMTRVCLEIGLTPAQVQTIITLRPNGFSQGVLIQQLMNPPVAIRRDQFEEAFSDLAMLSLVLKKK